jgi:hypothetical protein
MRTTLNTNTRTPLDAALAERDLHRAQIDAIDAKIERLSTLAQGTSPAVVERNAIVNDHQAALASWAETGDGDPPLLDSDRKARLEAEIKAFEDSRRSANDGISAMSATRTKHLEVFRRAEATAQFHGVESVATEALPAIVSGVNAALQAHTDAAGKLESLRTWILDEARRAADAGQGNGLFALAERLTDQANRAIVQAPKIIDATELRTRLLDVMSTRPMEAV